MKLYHGGADVKDNRTGNYPINSYDYIEGNVADDDIVNQINDYIDLYSKGRVDNTVVQFYLKLFTYAKSNHQICIRSLTALRNLDFIESEKL